MTQTAFKIQNRGFALIAALFMIVVLAALATFAIRLSSSQQQSMNLTVLSAQAAAMANTGIEYGANQALLHAGCNAPTTWPPLNQPQLNGFTIVVSCSPSHNAILPTSPPPAACPGNLCRVYELTSTATYSAFGQPNFVSRTVTRTVSNVP
jgi:MSHA biogenesis protein MshP